MAESGLFVWVVCQSFVLTAESSRFVLGVCQSCSDSRIQSFGFGRGPVLCSDSGIQSRVLGRPFSWHQKHPPTPSPVCGNGKIRCRGFGDYDKPSCRKLAKKQRKPVLRSGWACTVRASGALQREWLGVGGRVTVE